MQWNIKPFDALSGREVYELLKLRSKIFVVEQKCLFLDMDDFDYQCYHLLGMEQDRLVAYVRIAPPGVIYKEGSIGRVVADADARTRGIGRIMMKKALDFYDENFPGQPNKIMAQYYLTLFYESFGYVKKGSPYWEDQILHIDMLRNATK